MDLLAFIHIAKTGGRTIETMLCNTYGAGYCHAELWRERDQDGSGRQPFVVPKYEAADFRRLKRIWPFMQCVGGHAITLWSGLDEVQPVRWFAFVRDPLKRGASHFQFQARTEAKPKTWAEWIAWEVPRNHQLKMFSRACDPQEAIDAIARKHVFVGLLEHYDESVVMLKKLLAPELNTAYRRTNVARDNTIADGILADPVKREQLAEMHREELELYRYLQEDLFPRCRQAYGPDLAADVEHHREHAQRIRSRGNLLAHRLVRRFWIEPWGAYHRRRQA